MFNALSNVVGYLNAEGYCNADKCHVSTRHDESPSSCTVCRTCVMCGFSSAIWKTCNCNCATACAIVQTLQAAADPSGGARRRGFPSW